MGEKLGRKRGRGSGKIGENTGRGRVETMGEKLGRKRGRGSGRIREHSEE